MINYVQQTNIHSKSEPHDPNGAAKKIELSANLSKNATMLHFPISKCNCNSKTTCLKHAQQFYFRRCWHTHTFIHVTVKLHEYVNFVSQIAESLPSGCRSRRLLRVASPLAQPFSSSKPQSVEFYNKQLNNSLCTDPTYWESQTLGEVIWGMKHTFKCMFQPQIVNVVGTII